MLRSNNRVISEKVVRRLMAEEQLVVKRTRRRRYNSTVAKLSSTGKFTRPDLACGQNEVADRYYGSSFRLEKSTAAGYRLL
jgi:transposase InsO family protein